MLLLHALEHPDQFDFVRQITEHPLGNIGVFGKAPRIESGVNHAILPEQRVWNILEVIHYRHVDGRKAGSQEVVIPWPAADDDPVVVRLPEVLRLVEHRLKSDAFGEISHHEFHAAAVRLQAPDDVLVWDRHEGRVIPGRRNIKKHRVDSGRVSGLRRSAASKHRGAEGPGRQLEKGAACHRMHTTPFLVSGILQRARAPCRSDPGVTRCPGN